jgi:hypothetical protein
MASTTTQNKYKQGVAAVTESPMAKAATPEALNRYTQSVQNAVQSGKMARALNAVSLTTWQQAAAGRGAANLANGATKSRAKVDAAMQRMQPVWQAMRDAASSIPKGAKGDISAGMQRIQAALQMQQQMTRGQ